MSMLQKQGRMCATEEALCLKTLQILLVDNNFDNREMATAALEWFGATVTAVESASEALDSLQQIQFHCLISEIFLPEKDGCSLIREVRNSACAEICRIPAIAFTACKLDSLYEQVSETGFDAYYEKPLLPQDLAIIVNSLVHDRSQLDSVTQAFSAKLVSL